MSEVSGAELRKTRLGAPFKLLYGSGAMIDGVTTAALTYFQLFYLTSVCGLSGTLAGTALLVALLVDALVDPMIGLLSDNTVSRYGRRLPYVALSALPLSIAFGLLFSIPSSVTGTALLLYAAGLSMALRIGISLFVLPYVAVGAEVTDDYTERSSVVSYRIAFTMLGTFLVIALGLGVFMKGQNGLLDRAAYVPFGWTFAALMTLAGLTAAYATRGVLPRLHAPDRAKGPIVRQFVSELRDIFRNRSFVVLFLAVLAFFVAQGMAGALAIYLNRYFWGLPTSAVQLVLVGATLGPFIGAPITTLLARRFEKRPLAIGNFIVFVFCQMWPPLIRIAGFLPGSGSDVVAILFCNALVAGAALVGGAICAQSMMADAADEHEFLFGVRREALFFSGLTLAVKAASGLGGFLAGTALDLIQFPIALAAKDGELQLSASVQRDLGLAAGMLPAAITLLAPVALLGYRLSRERHATILTVLNERRAD